MCIFGQYIQLHQILASASAPSVRQWLWKKWLSMASRLVFQTPKCHAAVRLCRNFSEREASEDSAEFTNMYSLNSPPGPRIPGMHSNPQPSFNFGFPHVCKQIVGDFPSHGQNVKSKCDSTRHGPNGFSHEMAVYTRPNRHEFFFFRIRHGHVFYSALKDLSPMLLIDSIRAQKEHS